MLVPFIPQQNKALSSRDRFPHVWRLEATGVGMDGFFWGSLFGLRMAVFSLCLHVSFPLHASVCLISSLYEDTGHIGISPMHVNTFYFNGLFKGPVTKYSLVLRSWGLGAQHLNLGGGGTVHLEQVA